LDRPEDALDAFDKALDLNPQYVLAHNGRGNALTDLGRPEDALDAYDQALDLNPELALAWFNRGILLSDILDRPVEARRSFLRALHLAQSGIHSSQISTTAEMVSKIFRRLTFAPLLVVHMIERYDLDDVLLRTTSEVADAYERSRLYRVLQAYFRQREDDTPRRRHTVLGLAAMHLGDPFEAQDHFDRLDEIDDADLRGPFYLARTHQAYADEVTFEAIIEFARDRAEEVLRASHDDDGISAEQLYYAGQLCIAGEDPEPLLARRCFEQAAEQEFLPALYMQALLTKHVDGSSRAFDDAVAAVLDAERERAEDPDRHGFLTGERFAEVAGSADAPNDGTEASVEEIVARIEDALQHEAYAREIVDAVRAVHEWLEEQEDDEGRLPDRFRFADQYSVIARDEELRTESMLDSIEGWATSSDAFDRLAASIDEQRRATDLDELRTQLDVHENVPGSWVDDDTMEPEDLERRLATRIRDHRNEDAFELHRDLIVYFILADRLPPRTGLRLMAYLRVVATITEGAEFGKQVIKWGAGGLLSVGSVAWSPVLGIAQFVVNAVTSKFAESLEAAQVPDYSAFQTEFVAHLDGQPDAVHDRVRAFLDALEERREAMRSSSSGE
jgi:tetratricopeptide (TPR) repeat protein